MAILLKFGISKMSMARQQPAHADGAEHIMVYSGKLMMRFDNDETVLLETGDFVLSH